MKHHANKTMMLKNIRTYVLCILSMKYFLRENSSCCLLIRILHILASLRVTCHVSAARDTWHVRCYLSTRGKIGNRCKKRNKYGASGLLTTDGVRVHCHRWVADCCRQIFLLVTFVHSFPSKFCQLSLLCCWSLVRGTISKYLHKFQFAHCT